MADQQDAERTEEATDARREEFRRRGQVAQTKELASALLLLVTAGAVFFLSKFFFENLLEVFHYSFGEQLSIHIRSGQVIEALKFAAFKALFLILPFSMVAALIGFISSTIQTGFLQVEDALKPDFNKLDPIKNFARIFSLRSLVEGLKAIFKLLIVGTVMYLLLRSEMQRVPYLVTYSLSEIFHYTGTIIVKLFLGIGVLMLVMAGADYFFQWWKLEREMMMTRQEIKDETKQREGDPLIKSRIRRIQREVANRRMMEAVPKADVIITNPTHIAVALRYGEDVPAPQLIAKGADLVAEKIKSIAREHNIPIVENKPLARTIYKTMKIGQIIPRELFVAVAEVLAYVYKLRKKVRV